MSLWLAIALQTGLMVPDAGPADALAAAKPMSLVTVPRCPDGASSDDVVVCGERPDRYRLPLPDERIPARERERHEAQTGMAALTPGGRCGIFAGERSCGRGEAADYGYGKGRDPITVLGRLAGKTIDPDSD
jgi:hypothetical protein